MVVGGLVLVAAALLAGCARSTNGGGSGTRPVPGSDAGRDGSTTLPDGSGTGDAGERDGASRPNGSRRDGGGCIPLAETCNGIDDDCDGMTDEDLVRPCGSVCGSGVQRRVGGSWGPCDATAPAMEVCNGMDDDCDGTTDEDLSMPCSTLCGSGSRACVDGSWSECSARTPVAETCNGVDDDCDGTTDEGFLVRVASSDYGHLASHQPACDGSSQRWGDGCNSAIHRHCRDDVGCTDTGFGPVENSGSSAYVTCVAAQTFDVAYSVLASHHPGCDGTTQNFGLDCNAAIKRYCVANGFASGFGPVEHVGGTSATVACLPSERVMEVETSYTTLATHHPGCDGTTERMGPDCNAAIYRFCTSRGFASGFGPVENSGDTAYVACVRSD